MSDQATQNELEAAELEDLKERAKLLGVKHHPSISAEKLIEKIKEHQAAQEAAAAGNASNSSTNPGTSNANPGTPEGDVAPVETESQRIARIRADAERLIRIRVQCMNPAKKEWPGEVITVANRAVGTIRKYVPFNAEDGWHVPHMIYQVLKARECQVFVSGKSKGGVTVRTGKLIKEFAIEVLDPLTPQELKELAQRQAMEAGSASAL